MKIPLSKPFEYEDLSLTEIDLDFDKAKTNVLLRADKEMARRKHVPPVKQMDTTYCLLIASYISDLNYNVLCELPLVDGNNVATMVSGFLLGAAETEMETPTEAAT